MTSNFKTLNQQHKWLLPILILVIAAAIISLLMFTKPQPPKKETTEKAWLVSSEPISFVSVSPNISLLGHIESPFDSTISAAINSDIISVPVRDGEHVSRGQILMSLDAREIALVVAQRQADIDELKAQIITENNRFNADKRALEDEQQLLNIAVSGVKRQVKLQQSKLGSQERIDQAETLRAQKALAVNTRKLNIADHPSRLSQLNARLNRAKTALKDAEIDANRANITAPFDGIITAIHTAPGERVQLGQALISLYDRKNIEIRAQIPNRYIPLVTEALAQGKVIEAQTQHNDTPSLLALKRLSGQANQGTGGVDALFTPIVNTERLAAIDSQASTLILNSTLKVQVTLPPIPDVATLPLSAIYGSNRIYRIKNERLESIDVTILGKQFMSDGVPDKVIIQSELLKAGDIIATTQLPTAISGLKVIEREF